jgi:cation diffusion facilitator family transporter
MEEKSKKSIVAAIAGNVAAAVAKGAAAAFTRSSAMLSEAIHSLVDAANDGLILFGMARSRRPPDPSHPFGHGRELYFWTLVVGVLIFAVGGGMSVYEGILRVVRPAPSVNPAWSYAVLGASALFDGASWVFGWKAFRGEQRGRGILETIHVSKDPTSFSVLLEDSAALLGLLFAFAGVFLGQLLHLPELDGAASIAIGILLCVVAAVMVYESYGLLIGEGVEKPTLEAVRAMVGADPAVVDCGRLLTVYLGPDEVLLAIEIRFDSDMSATEVRHAVTRIKQAIQARFAKIRRIYFDAASISEVQ